MLKQNVSVSIVTATYNSQDTICDCISSVANQEYAKIEHVIVDGGSLDNTLNLVRSRKRAGMVLVSEPDRGIYDALNKGVKLATGDVVGFLHSDDVFADENVVNDIALAFSKSDVSAVYGDLEYVKKNDTLVVARRWKSRPFERKLLAQGWMPPHPTLYVRKEWYSRVAGFDDKYTISGDYHCVLKLFLQSNFQSRYLPRTLVKMRLGGVSNRSLKTVAIKSIEDYRALRSCRFSFAQSLLILALKNITKIHQII
jgi:glycosyltransferase involved in cell wall biosynthesis